MLTRKLTQEEENIIEIVENFVRDKHKHSDSHDYSHVLEVAEYSIQIAEKISDPVDPFILICGALLHDIGKTNHLFAPMHGLLGAALAEEFLEALGYTYPVLKKSREAICRIIARHTPTTMVPPETPEEKIVFDADSIDRLGVMGVLRGFIGKEGSLAEIIESKIESRLHDYEHLNYNESKELCADINEMTKEFIGIIKFSLDKRKESIRELDLYGAANGS